MVKPASSSAGTKKITQQTPNTRLERRSVRYSVQKIFPRRKKMLTAWSSILSPRMPPMLTDKTATIQGSDPCYPCNPWSLKVCCPFGALFQPSVLGPIPKNLPAEFGNEFADALRAPQLLGGVHPFNQELDLARRRRSVHERDLGPSRKGVVHTVLDLPHVLPDPSYQPGYDMLHRRNDHAVPQFRREQRDRVGNRRSGGTQGAAPSARSSRRAGREHINHGKSWIGLMRETRTSHSVCKSRATAQNRVKPLC